MTTEEMKTELERAFTERQDLTRKAECLRHRLRSYGRAFATLADAPFDADQRALAERAPDLSADWQALKRCLERIDELNRLLDLT